MTFGEIPVPVSIAVGASVKIADNIMDTVTIQTFGTFTLTVQYQGSLDNVNWVNEGAAQSAPGAIRATQNWRFLRANVTAFTSGLAQAYFAAPAN